MPGLRAVRDALLVYHDQNIIDDDELLLLYDLNSSKNPDFPYWRYDYFDLDKLSDAECKAEFRFLKEHIYELKEVFGIPDEIRTYNRLCVNGIESLCMFLKRFAYPIRYSDMIPRFGRPVPQFSIITNHILNLLYERHGNRLTIFEQEILSPQNLVKYANAIHESGAPIQNCWGFVDGTVRPICRPKTHQRIVYNGHKRVHSIKFQSVVIPNGLIANLSGPYEGKKHDSGMLAQSGLLANLENYSYSPTGDLLCIYGDPAYPLRPHLQGPFKDLQLTPEQRDFNKAMSATRVSVEWVFGDIINFFKFLDFKKNLKLHLSAVGKMYIVCSLLTNVHTILYGSVKPHNISM